MEIRDNALRARLHWLAPTISSETFAGILSAAQDEWMQCGALDIHTALDLLATVEREHAGGVRAFVAEQLGGYDGLSRAVAGALAAI